MEVKIGKCLCGEPERMETIDGKPVLIRCPLYQSLKVQNEKGEWDDEWKCSIAWTPILLIENKLEARALSKYVESFRNELVKRVDRAQALRSLSASSVFVTHVEATDAEEE